MAKSTTDSFMLELKLLASERDEAVLTQRFEYLWHIRIQLIKYARRQLSKLEADKHYRELLSERVSCPDKRRVAAIGRELGAIRLSFGLSLYGFKKYVKPMQHRFKKHIDSRTAQAEADKVWKAVDRYLFGDGNALRLPRLDDIRSVESNDNATGIKFRKGRIVWNGLCIQLKRDSSDTYAAEALRRRVKYCRIVRRPIGTRFHYYMQLVLEGTPPWKHTTGSGRVGIDPGTMSAAVCSEGECILTALDEGVVAHERDISRIQRAMDRSRRAMNPGNYNADGTVRKGRKRWKYSGAYRKLSMRKQSLERRRAASLKQHHEMLANRILALGSEVYTEDMEYKALQARAKETAVNSRGRIKRKKRFGSSLRNGAPAMLLSIIDRKLRYGGRPLLRVNTRAFRASQYDHVSDDYVRKRLSERHAYVGGHEVQRDLYSAFLLMNSSDDLQSADRQRCIDTFDNFLQKERACIAGLIHSNCKLLSSFGISRGA